MPGNELLAALRADLLAEDQAIPTLAIQGGRTCACNAAARAFFDRVRIGADVGEYFDERSREKLEQLLRSGAPGVSLELQVQRQDAPPVAARFLVLSTPSEQLLIAQDAPGYPIEIGAKLMATNSELATMTRELSRRMQDLESAKRELERLGELRELFIAALAHDLKTPLHVILLSEALFRKEAHVSDPLGTERHATKVERSAKRMLELIDSLLLAARLDAANEPSISEGYEVLRLDELARAIAEDLTPLADDAGVSIHVTSDEPFWVCGDSTWLGQVFANLLTNAIRHSPNGARVEVSLAASSSEVLCEITDQGPGLPIHDREKVFERCVQRGDRHGSIGLGLYVCRKIVGLHGGRIWADDAPGGGARFAFRLPRSDGEPRSVAEHPSPVLSEHGRTH